MKGNGTFFALAGMAMLGVAVLFVIYICAFGGSRA